MKKKINQNTETDLLVFLAYLCITTFYYITTRAARLILMISIQTRTIFSLNDNDFHPVWNEWILYEWVIDTFIQTIFLF